MGDDGVKDEHLRDLTDALDLEREQFDAFMHGFEEGAELPVHDLDRDEFREIAFEAYQEYRRHDL